MKFFFRCCEFRFSVSEVRSQDAEVLLQETEGRLQGTLKFVILGGQHRSGYFFAATVVTQSVEHPTKVPVWYNSTDVGSIPGRGIGVRKIILAAPSMR